MAQTPEKKVKADVVKILKEVEAYYFYPFSAGYGRSGVPDIVACHKGKFISIECKAGNNTTTALQDREGKNIRLAGGLWFVINEHNQDLLRVYFKLIKEDRKLR